MSDINFVIPVRPEELLSGGYGQYTVREVLHKHEIVKCLKAAVQCFRDEGPTYIISNFDVYFSVIRLFNEIPRATVYGAYEDMKKGLTALPNMIQFMKDEDSLSDERKAHMQNVIKMLTYLFVVSVQKLEGADEFPNDSALLLAGKGRNNGKKKKNHVETSSKCNWLEVITVCKNMLQADLNMFWDAPGADAVYTNLIAEICYLFLENPRVKQERETLVEIWNIFGLLLTQYHVDQALIMRLVRLVKEYDHVSVCLPDGVRHLIENFHCRGILNGLIKELTEWQLTDTNVESNGSKNCAKMLVEMAIKMPTLMLTEIMYLNIYLKSDSQQLRNMVLAVQVEVLLANLTKADPTPEERQLRSDILFRLERFTADSSTVVRSKVFAHIARLQMENAIPTTLLKHMLRRAVDFLNDTSANTRKAAAHCVTTMLKCNSFGPSLSLPKFQSELQDKKEELARLKFEMLGLDAAMQEETEQEWLGHVEELTEVVIAELEGGNDEESPPAEVTPAVNVDEAIREHIRSKNYLGAFQQCMITAKQRVFTDLRERLNTLQESELYVCFMHVVFSNIPQMSAMAKVTPDKLETLTKLETHVEHLGEICEFLQMFHEAMDTMRQMLNSATIGDMHAAVDFIITANQFELEKAVHGILDILKIMMRNEQDRRKIVLDALKTVYLVTDSSSLIEHTTQVVERLIKLLECVSYQQVDALKTLMAEWSEHGTIGNDIIDTLWKYILNTIAVPAQKSRAALSLLRMAAHGRHSIVDKNYRIVAHICFGERGLNDLLLAIEGLDFLIVLAKQPMSVTSSTARFCIPKADPIWTDLMRLVEHYVDHRAYAVDTLLAASVRFVFQLSEEPFQVIQHMLSLFLLKMNEQVPVYLLMRYNTLMGEIAIMLLSYLDNDVYKELNRRQHILQERKNAAKGIGNNAKTSNKSATSRASSRKNKGNSINVSINSTMNTTKNEPLEESTMDGAEAVDAEADFISYVLENNCISKGEDLGKLFEPIVFMCKQPDLYPNELVQGSACTALLRGMLVSSVFCEEHIRLVFVLLARTKFVENKVTILVHMSDLLEKSPNVVEPYTPKVYELLNDSVLRVRKMALMMLSVLILKDIIRPQEHVWKLAYKIVDSEPGIVEMAKSFFVHSAEKSNNLYNYLPDIFTHLYEACKDEQEFYSTLKYLFGLIDKTKHVENLVERFCLKYENTTDERYVKHITYALSLMTYNERALQKLIENFGKFKQFVLIDDVYAYLTLIISQTLKASQQKKPIKALTDQLEDLIKGVFELNEGRAPPLRPVENIRFKKPMAKPPRNATAGKRSKKSLRRGRGASSSSDSDSDDDKRTNKRKRERRIGHKH